jgi:hypothetical protein
VTARVCRALYVRPDNMALYCTFPLNHGVSEHSWAGIRCADTEKVDYTPQAVQAYLDSMTRGDMDAYLEAILAVAHSRKRAIRGTPGFRQNRVSE